MLSWNIFTLALTACCLLVLVTDVTSYITFRTNRRRAFASGSRNRVTKFDHGKNVCPIQDLMTCWFTCYKRRCYNHPQAKCTAMRMGCVCRPVWVLHGREVDCTGPPQPVCPTTVRPVQCSQDPCLYSRCRHVPYLECRPNFCGSCGVNFFIRGMPVKCGGYPTIFPELVVPPRKVLFLTSPWTYLPVIPAGQPEPVPEAEMNALIPQKNIDTIAAVSSSKIAISTGPVGPVIQESGPVGPIISQPIVDPVPVSVVKPEGPAVYPDGPAGKPEIPAVKPEIPDVNPEIPPVNPEIPPVKPEIPAVNPEIPPVKPEIPAVKPEIPAVNPEIPAVKPEGPIVSPESPDVNPGGPEVNPEIPAVNPEIPAVNPEIPAVKPEGPIVSPESPDVNPGGPAVIPEGPIVSPMDSLVVPQGPIGNQQGPVINIPVNPPQGSAFGNPQGPAIISPITDPAIGNPQMPIINGPMVPQGPVINGPAMGPNQGPSFGGPQGVPPIANLEQGPQGPIISGPIPDPSLGSSLIPQGQGPPMPNPNQGPMNEGSNRFFGTGGGPQPSGPIGGGPDGPMMPIGPVAGGQGMLPPPVPGVGSSVPGINPLVLEFLRTEICDPQYGVADCTEDPCFGQTCGRQGAVCRPSRCGTCHARWFISNQEVDCSPACRIGEKKARCFFDPCARFSCPAFPNAVCKVNRCRVCRAEWFVGGEPVNCGLEKQDCPPDHTRTCPKCWMSMCPSDLSARCRVTGCTDQCGMEFYKLVNGNLKIIDCKINGMFTSKRG